MSVATCPVATETIPVVFLSTPSAATTIRVTWAIANDNNSTSVEASSSRWHGLGKYYSGRSTWPSAILTLMLYNSLVFKAFLEE